MLLRLSRGAIESWRIRNDFVNVSAASSQIRVAGSRYEHVAGV